MADTSARLTQALADRYAIERELGRGGMATVYLAEDLKHHRKVAIKVLAPDLAANVGAERFLREIGITATLNHPHILPLYESGEADGFLYYVMPFVEGESLRGRLDREKQLPVGEAMHIAREIADALSYANAHDVVHRDIKPENILLEAQHAVVADFGIARAISVAGGARLTETGLAVGTPTYMSPEQAAGSEELDGRSDVYSLGCVLYEMLAGQPPFTGPTLESVVRQHLSVEPPDVANIRPAVPAGLAGTVARALAKTPTDRFARASQFVTALDAAIRRESAGLDRVSQPKWAKWNEPIDRAFRLSEEVCRKLNRATLDPRVIGDHLHYLDNQVESEVLICFLHGLGLDQRSFEEILRVLPYRGVAPTQYGFEPVTRRRIALSFDDHVVLTREFLHDAINRIHPALVVLVGFSSGADLGFRLLSAPDWEAVPRIDGFLSLGSNLSLETCFVTSVIARLSTDDASRILTDLRSFGDGAESLSEWLNVHEYLVKVLRRFHRDFAVLTRFAREIAQPFEVPDARPFVEWYRAASAMVRCLRCVFSDSDNEKRGVEQLRLDNLDTGVLGEHYREDSIVIEPEADHFDLTEMTLHRRYIEEIVDALR